MRSGEHDLWDAWMATGRDRALASLLADLLIAKETRIFLGKFGKDLEVAARRLSDKIRAEELHP